MQTTKQPTGLRTAAPDYETLVQRAINKVTGFGELYKELERAINVSGKSKSTLTNYFASPGSSCAALPGASDRA